jgi:Asp-tRNA(Asn)/Glu-tRNA(Gln) amidotransferase B subunit
MSSRQLNWIPTIGLEIHARIIAKQKLFSRGSVLSGPPNTHVALFDAAIPGTLPVPIVDTEIKSNLHRISYKGGPCFAFPNLTSDYVRS